jgi:5-methylcytosine-specific restriction endonuclease McrA
MMAPRRCIGGFGPCSGYAIPGTSRCRAHTRTNWHRRASAPRDYSSGEYRRNRAKILEGNPMCHWCGQIPATTADHVRREGGHELENLVPSCWPCNLRRGASLGGQVAKANRQRRNPQ